MDVNALNAATGTALDAAGMEIHLDRATTARGHGFDESDDSYRRRLVAQIAGAAAADALSQPAAPVPAAAPEAGKGEPPAAPALLQNGPTIEEWIIAGYNPENYPPRGYAARSTPEEIAAAIAAHKAALEHLKNAEGGGDANAAPPKVEGGGAGSAPHLP